MIIVKCLVFLNVHKSFRSGQWKLGGIVTLIVLGRKGPHGFPFRRPHSHFPID